MKYPDDHTSLVESNKWIANELAEANRLKRIELNIMCAELLKKVSGNFTMSDDFQKTIDSIQEDRAT